MAATILVILFRLHGYTTEPKTNISNEENEQHWDTSEAHRTDGGNQITKNVFVEVDDTKGNGGNVSTDSDNEEKKHAPLRYTSV